jgi:hypothetical protein
MLRWILSRQIDAFERRWRYDGAYMRELLAASPWSLVKFLVVAGMVDRRAAPAAALAGAGIAGTLHEDCGPCTQISVDMAAAGGVEPAVLRGVLAGDEAAMGAEAALGYAFAMAVLAHDLETADRRREEILSRWGPRGLAAISLSVTTARLYPTLKYALGHGRTCSKVVVAGAEAPFVRRALAA